MVMAGADSDQLDALARTFDGRAGQLHHMADGLTRQLYASTWGGADADDFRQEWSAVHVRQLQLVSDRLRDAGRRLAENARQQRSASAAGTGAIARSGGAGSRPLTPLEKRFAATRTQMERDRDSARAKLDALREKRKKVHGIGNWIADRNALDESDSEKLDRQIKDAENQVRRLDALLANPRRQFLMVDARGDGRIIEVMGDLGSADHVAVHVPGMSTTLDKYLGKNGQADARALYAAMDGQQPGKVAVVAFFDYDAPDGITASPEQAARAAAEVAGEGLARDGARNLKHLVGDLNGMGVSSEKITVVAHSYGSVVTGLALRNGMDVENAVVVGSPGLGLGTYSVADLHTDAHVYAGWAGTDPVPLAAGVSGAILPMPAHGANPADHGYGATPIGAGSGGHSSYFKGTPLLHIVDVAMGDGRRR